MSRPSSNGRRSAWENKRKKESSGLIEGHDRFDACTFETEAGTPVIVTKRDLPGDRQRMNIAHELGHFLMATDHEPSAFRFAGALLVPKGKVYFELGTKRRTLDLQELQILKHKYGMSMQGWIYRARELGVLSKDAAARLFRQSSTRGWCHREPGDPFPREEPQRLVRLVHRAVAEDLISYSRAAELLGQPTRLFFREEARQLGRPSISALMGGKTDDAEWSATLRH